MIHQRGEIIPSPLHRATRLNRQACNIGVQNTVYAIVLSQESLWSIHNIRILWPRAYRCLNADSETEDHVQAKFTKCSECSDMSASEPRRFVLGRVRFSCKLSVCHPKNIPRKSVYLLQWMHCQAMYASKNMVSVECRNRYKDYNDTRCTLPTGHEPKWPKPRYPETKP